MHECKTNIIETTCKCCNLLRGPRKILLKTRTKGCSLNFGLDGVPQFAPVPVEDGERVVEIYKCDDIPGYKNVYVTIVAQKE